MTKSRAVRFEELTTEEQAALAAVPAPMPKSYSSRDIRKAIEETEGLFEQILDSTVPEVRYVVAKLMTMGDYRVAANSPTFIGAVGVLNRNQLSNKTLRDMRDLT